MKLLRYTLAFLLLAGLACAAGLDGKWAFETTGGAGKKATAPATFVTTLDLKSDGAALKGTVTIGGRRRDTTMDIQNGKIDGANVSFTTVQKTRKAEQKTTWTATLVGDELRGTMQREGTKRGRPFTAKRK
jgi:hypothetical protein